ncbi:RNase adapter RapZ [Silvanigrella aquatica]|uniref:RNase adaptor protein RapZ n=1 Tax=Silvanigrella aquatica TaxID=1915309 RepID=A0A1L4D4M3_9BACT|nr:RNase adapter RapZ [Silvanigrella aquatica]APJ05165.1 RNase adaptor protein RapZ [Silvanigrella aquatica]
MENQVANISPNEKKSIIIVSGLAGSGKTVAIHALEDLGYYCIDNLPAVMLKSFSEAILNNNLKATHIALALDSRDQDNPKTFDEIYPNLVKTCHVQILYIKASEEVLLRRFRETRRHHPLSINSPLISLQDAIKLDEKTLEPIKDISHHVLDTSHMSSQYLKRFIHKQFSFSGTKGKLLMQFISFGFKHGTPTDLDTLLDVRCFKNPHYDPHLRKLTGLNPLVKDYVFSDPHVVTFISKTTDFLKFLYPLYLEEGKHYFSIGIGCTGGKHRSVAITEELAKIFKTEVPFVTIEHRHIEED